MAGLSAARGGNRRHQGFRHRAECGLPGVRNYLQIKNVGIKL
jgi:hypothetical protein